MAALSHPGVTAGVVSDPELGAELLSEKWISREGLMKALARMRRCRCGLVEALHEEGALDLRRWREFVCQKMRLPAVELDQVNVDYAAGIRLPAELALRLGVLAYEQTPLTLKMALCEPLEEGTLRELERVVGGKLSPAVARVDQLRRAQLAVYGKPLGSSGKPAARPCAGSGQPEPREPQMPSFDAAGCLERVLREAVRRGADAIHLEPGRIRLRLGARLEELQSPGEPELALVRDLVLEQFAIEPDLVAFPHERDGVLQVEGEPIAFRLGTVPCLAGRRVSLERRRKPSALELDALRATPRAYENLAAALNQSSGTVLLAGPRSSGRSALLFAAMRHLQDPALSLMSVEDAAVPELDGVVQLLRRPELGLTTPVLLRKCAAHQPDVLLARNLDDRHDREAVFRLALGSTLTLASMIWGDAASTLAIAAYTATDPWLPIQALSLVQSQRLLKRLCRACRRPWQPGVEESARFRSALAGSREGAASRDLKAPLTLWEPAGCPECRFTGYRGVALAAESVLLCERVREALARRVSIAGLRALLREVGIPSLRQSALHLVLAGDVSLAEALAATPADQAPDPVS
ncbi:MAG: Flp pilus assembly complex ATPase component TadA [Candidatus Wallbacteria bacterium]|nr:Flp pilus assembly complex ATPase component TadA [Candidatus Wallbacteria bacterium]